MKFYYKGGFESKFFNLIKLILALEYAHIARRFHYKME